MIKHALIIFSAMIFVLACTDKKPATTKDVSNKTELVTTVGYFDTLEAKSGYNINGYWVSLTSEQLKKYKGKKVEVKGTLVMVKAVDENAELKSQGASYDQQFITNPEIKIIE